MTAHMNSMSTHRHKTRIVSFVPSLGTGGTERVLVNLCRSLDRDRFIPEVCAFFSGQFESDLRELGIPVTILADETDRRWGTPGKVFRYTRRIRALQNIIGSRWDTVVHSHHRATLEHLYLLVRGTGLTFGWVHTEHNRPELEEFSRHWFHRTFRPLRRPDHLVGVSEMVTSFLREGCALPAGRTSTIVNGIDITRYGCADPARKRRELGIPPDCPLVGAVGNLRPEKNQGLLLKGFALLPPESGAHLVICGDGECRGELERCAAELGLGGRVHFLGSRLDAHEIMALFDVFCLPSRYEGLPMTVLEAWAARVPVVATEVVGIRELVRHGENGYLVPLDEPRMMADDLQLLLQDRVRADALRSRGAAAVEQYSAGTMARRYEALYERAGDGVARHA